jgi:hypothetical protein
VSLITITHGHENFDSGSARVSVFAVAMFNNPLIKDLPVDMARHEWPAISRLTNQRVSAGAGMKAEIAGEWITSGYDVPNGTILRVYGQKTTNTFGVARHMANILIRVRDTAAYRRIGIALVAHRRSNKMSAVIEGRFDVLTLEQGLALGVTIPAGLRGTYAPEFVNRLCTITTIEPEIIGPSVVEDRIVKVGGEDRVVQISKKRRAMDL